MLNILVWDQGERLMTLALHAANLGWFRGTTYGTPEPSLELPQNQKIK